MLIEPNSLAVNGLFVLSFENNSGRTNYTIYYLPQIEIKHYNVMINEQKFYDQPVKNNLITKFKK